MIQRLGLRLSQVAQRWMPDPFLFAAILTLVTFALALGFTEKKILELIRFWAEGLWTNLTFAMQMCLILVTGHALATSPPVRGLLDRLSRLPRTAAGAVALVALLTCVASLIHWGLGVIVGALLAREVALAGRGRGLKLHYPLLGAAAYMGLLVWHGGLSGSAPLQAATPGKEIVPGMGLIPVSATLFSPLNLVLAAALTAAIVTFCYLLTPRDPALIQGVESYSPADQPQTQSDITKGPARRLEHSRLLSLIIAGIGLAYVFDYFWSKGFDLNLDIVNATFLFLGILFQGTPLRYVQAVAEGTKSVSGIILQFPFYFGIQGLMAQSGLIELLSQAFIRIATPTTFHLYVFWSAGLVNLFIPSGGGQWVVQGPVMIRAAQTLGLSIPKTIMAIAYGDEWTNMIQPFWAIPVMGITKLKAGEIIGYSALICLVSGFIYSLAILLLPA